jgi:hypothetical protein
MRDTVVLIVLAAPPAEPSSTSTPPWLVALAFTAVVAVGGWRVFQSRRGRRRSRAMYPTTEHRWMRFLDPDKQRPGPGRSL